MHVSMHNCYFVYVDNLTIVRTEILDAHFQMVHFQIFVLLWNLCNLFTNCGCMCTFLADVWHQDVSIT